MRRAPLLALAACLAPAALGHPPDADGGHHSAAVRSWTDGRTGETLTGSFLASYRSGGAVRVCVERPDGRIAVLALDDLRGADREEAELRIRDAEALNGLQPAGAPTTPASSKPEPPAAKPPQAAPFDCFGPFVKTRSDDRWLYVESDGLPHAPWTYPLMVGIKSWQRQAPLPQPYTGDNAWRIPLRPVPADKPVSGRTALRRGAIALAANGVPIFNALNNRGDDAFKAGELDEFGGHSGRADDYHYHTAPLAIQKIVGRDKPIAYALDGYAIYGLFDPAAKAGEEKCCPLGGRDKLDELNGHLAAPGADGERAYHYHASLEYPYINGGMRGKVVVKDDQIDPQPRCTPVREAGRPLRGASITGFRTLADRSWALEYTIDGVKREWKFRLERDAAIFDFEDADGAKHTERFPVRNPPAAPGKAPRPAEPAAPGFSLTSAGADKDGRLAAEFTCDGKSQSPPLAWTGAPAGARSFAVTMHHIPGPRRPGEAAEDKHVYLVLYNIPAATASLDKGLGKSAPGAWGVNTVNRRAEYAPPCSKGPGAKSYTLTVYALSAEPTLAPKAEGRAAGPTMDALLETIKDKTLASASVDVTYERQGGR